MARYDSILQTIGRTPVVRLNRLAPEGVNIWVKVEAFNPLGSVKDRLAAARCRGGYRIGPLPIPLEARSPCSRAANRPARLAPAVHRPRVRSPQP